MEIKKILEQVQEQQQQSVKNTNKPFFDPLEVRKLFVYTLNKNCLKSSFGVRGLELNEENERVIELVCQYLNNESEFETENENFSLKKGLWIYGNFGSGKTEIMKTYKFLKHHLFNHVVGFKTCTDMNDAYMFKDKDNNTTAKMDGIKVFCNFITPSERIFDDLGAEEITLKDYGNAFSVMPYILSQRHKGCKDGCITHITTNLSKKQITTDYGGRIESRTYEMFNMILLGKSKDAIDYRKK